MPMHVQPPMAASLQCRELLRKIYESSTYLGTSFVATYVVGTTVAQLFCHQRHRGDSESLAFEHNAKYLSRIILRQCRLFKSERAVYDKNPKRPCRRHVIRFEAHPSQAYVLEKAEAVDIGVAIVLNRFHFPTAPPPCNADIFLSPQNRFSSSYDHATGLNR